MDNNTEENINEIKRISQRNFIDMLLKGKNEDCVKLFTSRLEFVQTKSGNEFLSNESLVIILMLVENSLERKGDK